MKEKGRRLVVVNTNPRKNVSDTVSGTATRRSVAGGGSGANIGDTETGALAEMTEMFELRKTSTPWLIFVKQMFYEFTVKNPITLLSGLIFKKNDLSKPITDIKRSTDSDNEFLLDEDGNAVLDEEGNKTPDPLYVPVNDETIPTTRYTEDHFLCKDKDDRSKGKISSDVGFEVGEFVSGASGATIYKDKTNGQTVGELDKLYVRMKAYFETLEIVNVNTVGGKQILSPGGSVKCIGMEERAKAYRCYFLGEQDGEVTENRWEVNDQAYSQMFNAKLGVSNKISNTYYWRLVTGVSADVATYQGKKCHYIDLSKTDADTGSDVPKAGDVINQRGNRSDIDRMNFIEQSSVSSYSPNITLFHGVNSYSLDGKAYVDFGVDKSTNKAYMNVYGDMYVGDRDGTNHMRYTQDGGLEIRGKFVNKSGKDLEELIKEATPEGYKEFVDKVTQELEGLQQQIDGVIESFFYQYDPTSENYPASEWETVKDKAEHLNDTFTNIASGNSWRWVTDGSGNFYWKEIEDTATVKALAAAGKAQDTADGKRRVFVSVPKPPYDLGDLWAGGTDAYLMVCVKEKGESESFEASDWDFADNSSKLNKELSDLVQTTKDDLNNAIGQAKDASNKYTDDAKAALQTSINEMNEAKANVLDVYTKAQADGKISDAEEDAIAAAKVQADAAIALSEATVKAYADGVVDAEEAARIKEAAENLAAAKKYAEEKANEAYKNALTQLATFDYLKAALKEDTTVEGGLIQSSLIKLGYTGDSGAHVTMSGSNGIYNKQSHGGGIASWWGGEMKDILDYYTWNGTNWVLKSGLSAPTNLPAGLIRFDGTGFLAGGKFWWDDEGEIHADPTALLLSFDVSTGDETLAATIVNLRKEIARLSGLWERKTDGKGHEYIYTPLPIVTQSGVSMYSDTSGLDLPGVYDGLPIDGSTLYWENGVLKAKAGGDSITSITAQMITDALGYTPYDANNPQQFITSKELAGYQPLISADNKLDYSLLSGAPASLASPYALTIRDSGGAAKVTYDGSSVQSLTLTKAMVGLDKVENVALSGWTGSGKLTTVGTITSGTWQGGKIGNGYLANSSVSISGKSVSLGGSLSQADLRSALGLGSNAYTSTEYLAKSAYTAADVLAKLKTVDGSGSGLDADTLNGRTLDDFYINRYNDMNNNDYNNCLRNGAYLTNQFTPNDAYPFGLVTVFRYSPACVQLYFPDNNGEPRFRCQWNSHESIKNEWTNLVTSSSIGDYNAGSATKLATARKIWGQSFDGTGDVTGDMKIEGNLVVTGGVTADTLRASGLLVATGGLTGSNWCINDTSDNPYLKLTQGSGWYIQGLNGYLYIGAGSAKSLRIDSSGNVLAAGGVTMYSDIRKKTKVGDVELTLREVADAPLIAHYYKSDEGRTLHVGSIAQYWAEMNDWFCKADGEGYLTMEVQNAALASAISVARELVRYEDETDVRIRTLTARVRELEKELNDIKKEKGN